MTSSPAALDPATLAEMQSVLALARKGDSAGAIRLARTAISAGRASPVLLGFLGLLLCQAGQLAEGIDHLRKALLGNPADRAVRGNLVQALIQSGDLEAALAASPEDLALADPSLRLARLRGWLLQQSGDFAGAATLYRHIVRQQPDDFESWNNLGNALSGAGEAEDALQALDAALALRPDVAPVRFNRAATLAQLGRHDEAIAALESLCADAPDDHVARTELAAMFKLVGRDEDALAALEAAAQLAPDEPPLQVKLALERQYAWQMEGAEQAFRRAIALQPTDGEANLLLALHLEHLNRTDDLVAAVAVAESQGVEPASLHFMRALAFRREKRFEEGLAELAQVPDSVEPIRRAQLLGQFHERLGHDEAAFAAFAEMNRLQKQDPTEPLRRAADYRAALEADRALITPDFVQRWKPVAVQDGHAAPAFLLGFPRSGTTLLDTLLMGHPSVRVLEERPPIARVEAALGGWERLPDLGEADVVDLRRIYFEEAAKWVDLPGADGLLVDKFPLHLNKLPIIHRLFPDARTILALRHPCDVLLSCFITNFRLNSAMANFLDLETGAWLYDQAFGFWHEAAALFGVSAHTMHYEQIVENSEAALKPLFAYLGLDWQDGVLDHQRTAAGRSVITTASYAQVTEPLYQRAHGRWHRFAQHLEPVMPVLQPWIDRFGYTR